MFSLSFEALYKIVTSNVATIINIEVMECEVQIGFCKCLLFVDGYSQEFRVLNLTIIIQINFLKNVIKLVFR